MEKTPFSKYQIRFPDCDPFNHLNNARYLDYFMNAREDHLMKYYQFSPYQRIKEAGTSWVVSENRIAYIRPALLMEEVLISSSLRRWGDSDVQVEMLMWDKDQSKIKSVLWARFVHFNIRTQKVESHTPDLTERFQVLENPFPSAMSFEERTKELKLL